MAKKYDLNRMRKIYPLNRKIPRLITTEENISENTTIDMSDGQPKIYSFKNTYYQAPICLVTVENENVNAFITNVNLNSVTIEISADPPDNCLVHLQVFSNIG